MSNRNSDDPTPIAWALAWVTGISIIIIAATMEGVI